MTERAVNYSMATIASLKMTPQESKKAKRTLPDRLSIADFKPSRASIVELAQN